MVFVKISGTNSRKKEHLSEVLMRASYDYLFSASNFFMNSTRASTPSLGIAL